ncbi:anaerobic ribonucleoside-triphosphate reductase activating protein [Sphingobacterium sp. SGG-5]|nr:anaerobic ribonucleoside-triphosphate reductase activating protein [Sphingobacterium sp. SGG-5]
MPNPIYGITPFTLLDYPNHPACILWFAGCNMRCVYCYNPDIVLGKGKLSLQDTIRFLESRQALLQGVVFSGGECTLHPAIFPLARAAKDMGYRVKIDTNGTKPHVLKKLLDEQLIDYIALDFKGIGKKHENITQSGTFSTFSTSLALLQSAGISFEIRTTWHSTLLTQDDISTMIAYLEQHDYQGDYFIQYFMNHVETLETLPYAQHILDIGHLSTTDIRVKIRNGLS